MGSAAGLLLLGAALIATVGAVGVWFALKSTGQALQRRQRSVALAAAERYTPAGRVSLYGAAPDPCAPGLNDHERVEAMRALLLRGDKRAEASLEADGPARTPQSLRDDPATTSPMAWKPTMPSDDAAAWEQARTSQRGRLRGVDHEHITI